MPSYLQERNDLVDELDNCPQLQSNEGRQDVIRDLSNEISALIQYRSERKPHIWQIVIACLNVPNGISQLESRLKYWDGKWTDWCKVEEAAKRLQAKLAEEKAPTTRPDEFFTSKIDVRTQTTRPTAVATSEAKVVLNPAASSEQMAPAAQSAQQAALAALPGHKERTNPSPALHKGTVPRGGRVQAKRQAASLSAREAFVAESLAAQIIPYVKLLENMVDIVYDDLILFDTLLDKTSYKLGEVEALNAILHMQDTRSPDTIAGVLERLDGSIAELFTRLRKEAPANAESMWAELSLPLEKLETHIHEVVEKARRWLDAGALPDLDVSHINILGGCVCRSLASATKVVQKIAGAVEDKITHQRPMVQRNINGSRYGGHS